MMLADTMEIPPRRRSRISWTCAFTRSCTATRPRVSTSSTGIAGDRLGQRRFRGGFDKGGGIVDLEQKLRRIADHVLQDQGHVEDVGIASQNLHACRQFAVSGRQDKVQLRFS